MVSGRLSPELSVPAPGELNLSAAILGKTSELELQALFAGGIGQCLDLAMIDETAAVKNDLGDVLGDGAFGDGLANLGGRGDVCLALAETFLLGGGGHDCLALIIIDELGIDILVGKID